MSGFNLDFIETVLVLVTNLVNGRLPRQLPALWQKGYLHKVLWQANRFQEGYHFLEPGKGAGMESRICRVLGWKLCWKIGLELGYGFLYNIRVGFKLWSHTMNEFSYILCWNTYSSENCIIFRPHRKMTIIDNTWKCLGKFIHRNVWRFL